MILGALPASAQDATAPDAAAPPPPLIVATKTAAPLAFKGPDGAWTGMAIDAMTEIAGELGRTFQWREQTLEEMLDAVEAGDVDAAVAAITVTFEREARLDFTFPYYTSGLGIAIDPKAGGG